MGRADSESISKVDYTGSAPVAPVVTPHSNDNNNRKGKKHEEKQRKLSI